MSPKPCSQQLLADGMLMGSSTLRRMAAYMSCAGGLFRIKH